MPFLHLLLLLLTSTVKAWRPWPHHTGNATSLRFEGSKRYEGSSEFVDLKYHMGPVLTENITIYPIWYGKWTNSQKRIIRDFLSSISAVNPKPPSVSGWWKTVQLYTDQTGSNISRTVRLGVEKNDRFYSESKKLTRLTVQKVIKNAVNSRSKPLPVNPKTGVYLLLTSDDVYVQDFCQGACGFHYFTFPSIVGYTLPYAWIAQTMPNYHFEPGGENKSFLNNDRSRIQIGVAIRFVILAARWAETEGEYGVLASLVGDSLGPIALAGNDGLDI
ncbi:hypothetical protein LIER_41087 [Lithospermum erythrorhizon]|uniref:Uncharacterized protein n=1 Tax=Lithospermum erythrorhizon TaxID=34254 RepID=A0AAV3R460_LITER